MGLLDCVASPEDRDTFDENERPVKRPQELSRSDHDISRRRGLPLFASQTSLKNIRDVDFWRQRVLRYLFSPEGKEDIRILRVPFNQLGYATVTDFITDIPQESFQPYLSEPAPDEGLLKEYKVFWVKDGIAEPGTFKWEGRIEKEYCLGLQLDRKKAVPYGIHDGKGLFYCKPGHRAIVPETEVVPYKKFLRSYLGLPPKKDSLQEFRESVRLSARAIRAKNFKPGDRVYLPKEQKWATVQWIGKIDNETVVDLIYERPKPDPGQPVSPDEPCVSRSISLADFIGELSSEPNTPIRPQAPQSPKSPPPKTNQLPSPLPLQTRAEAEQERKMAEQQQQKSQAKAQTPPRPQQTSVDDASLDNWSDDHDDEDDDDSTEDDETSSGEEESDEEAGNNSDVDDYHSDYSEDRKVLPRTKEVEDMTKASEDKIEVFRQDSPKISSPKRKGFFGFSPKDKKRSKSLPSVRKEEKVKEKVQSELELAKQQSPPPPKSPKPRSKSPNIFSNFRFKKNPKKQKSPAAEEKEEDKKELMASAEDIKEPETPKSKSKPKKSQWQFGGLFKSKSKGSLSKLAITEDSTRTQEDEGPPQTPVDKMVPPDTVPTPPPFEEERFQERKIDRPEHLDLGLPEDNNVKVMVTRPTPPGPPSESYEEAQKRRGEVRLDPHTPSSESESDDDGGMEEEVQQVEVETTNVQMHPHQPRTSSDSSDAPGSGPTSPRKVEEVKSPESENRKDDFPVYLAICPPYIPPQKEESPSPPPIPSSPPPESDAEWELPKSQPQPPPPEHKPEPVVNKPMPPTKPRERSPPTVSTEPEPQPEKPAVITTPTTEPSVTPEPEPSPFSGQSSLDKFKESKVRNRPSSFGSFLARIKNQKKIPGEVIKYPDGSTPSPTPTPDQNVEEAPRLDSPPLPSPPPEEVAEESQEAANTTVEDLPVTIGIRRTLVKPKSNLKPKTGISSMAAPNQEGDQDGIVLDFLDVDESNAPVNTPPPVPPQETTPTPKPKTRSSFTFAFPKKRKPSNPQTPVPVAIAIPPTPAAVAVASTSLEELNNDNAENIEPSKKEKGSFRSSFRRTFSLTRKNKRSSIDTDEDPTPNPSTPKPRPVTLYIDNNDVVEQKQKKNSFRNKRPASVVVDIKPWDMRHGSDGVDIYSSPSSEEAPRSPDLRSPNPALLPKVEIVDIPKHRIFTTPAFFNRNKKKQTTPISTTSQTIYKKFNEPQTQDDTPTPTPTNENQSLMSPSRPKTPPALPMSPPPPLTKQRPKSTAFEVPTTPAPVETQQTKLKSALKQRKEIESIPRGLKIGDRVLWYSAQGPIPGTVQRLFKDGTDKYTAMVKFDREVTDAPLRLIREGDAFIITVEELITPDMFEPKPIYANQEQIGLASPSVRFNEGFQESDSEDDDDEDDDHDFPPPFQQEEVQMACGFQRGIQCRDKSCCLESILFSMFYTTNAFEISMLYGNSAGEDKMTKKVRKILRKDIVDPLRRSGFVSCQAVKNLREAVKPLSEEWQTMSTDAEVMMFILFDQALKLEKFLCYSNGISDFLHQLVVDAKDLSKSTTIQHLFEASLGQMENKLQTAPTPALILELPRSNEKLMHYKAVIPSLSLHISHLLQDGPRLCICGVVAQYECLQCTQNVGRMSIVFCDNCKGTADIIHFQLPHESKLSPLNQPVVILDLCAILCVSQGHYISFVKCGKEKHSPWVYFDGAEIDNPKVCVEENLGMWLDRLEKFPGKYQDALQYPLLTHILQDSHICIYQPREKSSSV